MPSAAWDADAQEVHAFSDGQSEPPANQIGESPLAFLAERGEGGFALLMLPILFHADSSKGAAFTFAETAHHWPVIFGKPPGRKAGATIALDRGGPKPLRRASIKLCAAQRGRVRAVRNPLRARPASFAPGLGPVSARRSARSPPCATAPPAAGRADGRGRGRPSQRTSHLGQTLYWLHGPKTVACLSPRELRTPLMRG
jgi:hypothetical protein